MAHLIEAMEEEEAHLIEAMVEEQEQMEQMEQNQQCESHPSSSVYQPRMLNLLEELVGHLEEQCVA